MSENLETHQYSEMLRHIVTEIKSTRVVAAQRINSAMIQMYWNIGKRLSVEKLEKGYGSSVVKRLSADLQEQATEILKSTYNLEMLGLKHPLKERELEQRLVEKIKFFLLELGTGFTFIGNQHRLTHNDK